MTWIGNTFQSNEPFYTILKHFDTCQFKGYVTFVFFSSETFAIITKMNSITRQLRLINLNFPLCPNVKFTRNIHLLRSATEISSISVNKRNDCNDNLFKSLQCNKLNSNAYLPVRFKSKQKHPKKSKSTDDYSSDEDDDDMAEFREGNKSDKSLAQIKVQSMRLDALIKSGLGISRK